MTLRHLDLILKIYIQATAKFWKEYELMPIIQWADRICN